MTRRKRSDSDANDIVKRVAGKAKQKNLIIDQNPQGMFFVRYEGGGVLPRTLSGKYLRYEIAQYAVDSYLTGK